MANKFALQKRCQGIALPAHNKSFGFTFAAPRFWLLIGLAITPDIPLGKAFDNHYSSDSIPTEVLVGSMCPSPLEHITMHSLPRLHCSSDFIPTEVLVGSSGLEPPTSRLSGVRSNRLSYEPMSFG